MFNDTNSLEKTVENLDEKTNIDSLQDHHAKLLIEYQDLSNEFNEKIFENDVIHSLLEKHEVVAKEEIAARKLKIEKKVNFLELLNTCLNIWKERLASQDKKINELQEIEKNLKKEINQNLKTKNQLNIEIKTLEQKNLEIQEELKKLQSIKLVEESNFKNLRLQKNALSEDIESLKSQNQVDLWMLLKITNNIEEIKKNKKLIEEKIEEENLKIFNLNDGLFKQTHKLNNLTLNSRIISKSYKKNKKEYEEKTKKFNSLKTSNEKIENDIEFLNAQIFNKEQTQNELKRKIEKFQSDNNSKTKLLKQKKDEKAVLENTKNNLKNLNTKTHAEITTLTTNLQNLNSEVANLEAQILQKTTNTKPLINDFVNSINENQKLKEKKQELESKKIIYDFNKSALKAEISNLKISLDYQNSENTQDISAELTIKEAKIQTLLSNIKNLNTKLTELKNSIKTLNSQNVSLTNNLGGIDLNDRSLKIKESKKIEIIDWSRQLENRKARLRKSRIKYAHKLSNLFNFLAQSKNKAFFSFGENLNSIQQTGTFEKIMINDGSKKIKLMKFLFGENNIFICNNNHLLNKFTEETTDELEKKLNWNYPISIIKGIKDQNNQIKTFNKQEFKYFEFQIIASNDQSTAFGQNLVKNWMKVEVGVLVSENALTEKFDNFFYELKLASEGVRQGLDDIASHLSLDLNIQNSNINNALKESFAIAKDYYSKLEW